MVIADDDGVCIVERQRAEDVAKASEARALKEFATRERLARGELGVDIYDLRKKLAELGLKYI